MGVVSASLTAVLAGAVGVMVVLLGPGRRRAPVHARWARGDSRVRVTIIRHAESENNVLFLAAAGDSGAPRAERKADPSLTGATRFPSQASARVSSPSSA